MVLLDEKIHICYSLVSMLILVLYPIGYTFQLIFLVFNVISDFIPVSLATIVYADYVIFFSHILLGLNLIPLVHLNYIVLLIEDIFKMVNDILCSLSYHTYFTLYWIVFLYFFDKSRALLNSSQRLLCFSIYCCACNKASYIAEWINFSLYTPLLFWSFSILDFKYSNIVRIFCAFVGALSLLLQAWADSFLKLSLLLQA